MGIHPEEHGEKAVLREIAKDDTNSWKGEEEISEREDKIGASNICKEEHDHPPKHCGSKATISVVTEESGKSKDTGHCQ